MSKLAMLRLGFIAALLLIGPGFAALRTPAQAQDNDACVSAPAGLSEQTLEYGGETRRYLLYTPGPATESQPVPVVFSLHGFASNARQQMELSRWNEVADANGFLAVYPQGLGFPARWNAGALGQLNPGRTDDTGFLRALAAELVVTRCADPGRLFVNGLSNGGGMTYRLACEASDVFAAFGGVAGAYAERLDCAPGRPAPFLFFHGTADPIVPFEGGPGLPNVPAFVAGYAAMLGCASTTSALPASGSVTGVLYDDCPDGAQVGFYTIDGGGHTWPGGVPLPGFLTGETTQDISASETLWDFYQAHPRAGSE
ncbi:MAG: extracellular catalytic domain type 1 short-chain-length polyhydroxyalkanoate depolymerase [Caldilineaceae bacterium]